MSRVKSKMAPFDKLALNLVDLNEMQGQQDVLFQSRAWALLKQQFGWTPYAFSLLYRGKKTSLLVLSRSLARIFSFAYVPYGLDEFELSDDDLPLFLGVASKQIQSFLPHRCLFIRYDIQQGSMLYPLKPLGSPLVKGLDVQPPDTVLLDLRPSLEAILQQMHPKTRYNIRLSEKKGISVREEDASGLSAWYKLYRQTATRDRITIHPLIYYQTLYSLMKKSCSTRDIKLLMAYHGTECLAAILVARCGAVSTYLYGASSNTKRNLMPSYALQWAAICDAKACGAITYDMFGIPPTSDKSHPMSGLYPFKTGFGGVIFHHYGAWDFPFSFLFYRLYRIAEKLRAFYYKVWKKR